MPRRSKAEVEGQLELALSLFARGWRPDQATRAIRERFGATAVDRRTVERWYRTWRRQADPGDWEVVDLLAEPVDVLARALRAARALTDRDGEPPPLVRGFLHRAGTLAQIAPDCPPELVGDLAVVLLAFDAGTFQALTGEPFEPAVLRFLACAPWRGDAAAERYLAACREAGVRRAFGASTGLGTHPPRLVFVPLEQPAGDTPAATRRHVLRR
mgnify:FL=1